ncbi:hypothetical protein D9M72_561150 [compost metagenome]
MGNAGNMFGSVDVRGPPADAAHGILDQCEKQRCVFRSEAADAAMHQSHDGCPNRAFRHAQDRAVAAHVGKPRGRGHTGYAQEVDDPPEDGAVIGEQTGLVPGQEF